MSLAGYVAGPHQSEENPLELAGWSSSVVLSARGVQGDARPTRRRGQRQLRSRRGPSGERRRHDHGPQYVRPGPRGVAGRVVARLVGRGPALPPPGVRAHAPPTRTAADERRHHVSLRYRWDRAGARAGQRGRRGRDIWLAGGHRWSTNTSRRGWSTRSMSRSHPSSLGPGSSYSRGSSAVPSGRRGAWGSRTSSTRSADPLGAAAGNRHAVDEEFSLRGQRGTLATSGRARRRPGAAMTDRRSPRCSGGRSRVGPAPAELARLAHARAVPWCVSSSGPAGTRHRARAMAYGLCAA